MEETKTDVRKFCKSKVYPYKFNFSFTNLIQMKLFFDIKRNDTERMRKVEQYQEYKRLKKKHKIMLWGNSGVANGRRDGKAELARRERAFSHFRGYYKERENDRTRKQGEGANTGND